MISIIFYLGMFFGFVVDGKPNPHPVIAWIPVRDVYRKEDVIENE